MNDDEIINLFLKRDENGIIELSTKYHPYCYKIAWNLLANREDAEECVGFRVEVLGIILAVTVNIKEWFIHIPCQICPGMN